METKFKEFQAEPGKNAWSCIWIVSAPWAHPFWDNYRIILIDLTTDIGKKPHLELPDATHEVIVHALDPAHPIPNEIGKDRFHVLLPANHAYQFKVTNHALARIRIQDIVTAIEEQRVSPDTDFISVWNKLFEKIGVTLRVTR